LNRGVAWNDKREYDRALADYAEAIRLDPDLAPAYLGRGWARQMKGQYDEAITDYTEAIRLDPRYTLAFSNRGVAWAAKREYDRALTDHAEAIRLDPEFAWPYNNRAWIWATCPDAKYRDGTRAIESATRACELTHWKRSQLIGTLAAAYAETGDFDAAVKWQSKANALSSDTEAKRIGQDRLELYRERKPYRETK
jgi:tetratricopeptide (TPR) repeat protein